MGKIRNREEEAQIYTDTLNQIKEEGSTVKQTTTSKQPGGKLKNLESTPNWYNVDTSQFNTAGADKGKSSYGTSQYDKPMILPYSYYDADPAQAREILDGELREARAQAQPASHQIMNGLGRFLSTAVTTTGKGIGYIGGIPFAIAEGSWEPIVDNAFVNMFQDIDDSIKEEIPIYTRRAIEDGSFWKQIWALETLAGEGADMAGFMASSMITGWGTGTLMKALSISKYTAQGLKAAGLTKNLKATEKGIQVFSSTVAQSYIESNEEAQGLMRELKEYWGQYDAGDGTYAVPKPDGRGVDIYTQEQVEQAIKEATVSTFGLNMGVTFLPNLFVSKAIFGGGSKGFLTQSGLAGKSFKEIDEALKQAGKVKNVAKAAGGEFVKGTVGEGSQEWGQFAIQEYNTAKAKFQTDDDLVIGLIEGLGEGLTTVEGQKSIFFGAVMGGFGPGTIQAYKTRKKQIEQARGLSKILQTNITNFEKDAQKYYVKNEDGTLKIEDGAPVIDFVALTEAAQEMGEHLGFAERLAASKLSGDVQLAREIATRQFLHELQPALMMDGGLETFLANLKENYKNIEIDSHLYGFDSKESYVSYLEGIAKTAQEAYNLVENNGPSFFGLKINNLITDNKTKKDVEKHLEQFYGKLKYAGSMYAALEKVYEKDIDEVITNIEKTEELAIESYRKRKNIPVGEEVSLEEALKDMSVTDTKKYEADKKTKETLEKQIEELNKNYKLLFDVKEQQRAFEDFVKNKKEEAKVQEEAEAELKEEKEYENDFYDNLIEKGYGKHKDDFKQAKYLNNVRLKDKDGNLYALRKEVDEKGNPYYNIYGLDEYGEIDFNRKDKLTKKNLEKYGISEKENILTIQEFKEWRKVTKIKLHNKRKLEYLRKLFKSKEQRGKEITEAIEEQTKKLQETQEQIDILLTKIKRARLPLTQQKKMEELSFKDILEPLEKLEKQKEEISTVLEDLNRDYNDVANALAELRQMAEELKTLDANSEQYSFQDSIKDFKQKLRNKEYTRNADLLDELLEKIKQQIDQVLLVDESINETIDSLYNLLVTNDEFTQMIRELSQDTDGTLFEKIKNFLTLNNISLNGVIVDDNIVNDISGETLLDLLKDPEVRENILDLLLSEKRALLNSYSLARQELADNTEKLERLRKRLNALEHNKQYLDNFLTIESLIDELYTIHRAQKETELGTNATILYGQNTNLEARIEQDATEKNDEDSKNKKKEYNNLASTVVNVYEDRNFETPHTDPAKLEQATEWARAMSKIKINELDDYSIRIINNKQLQEEYNTTPPIEDENALYTVLYRGNSPVRGTKGNIIFTGIANTSTYFPDGKPPLVSVNKHPVYVKAQDANNTKKISTKNPFTYNKEVFHSLTELEDYLLDAIKENYNKWRKELVVKVKENPQYSKIKDVSRGYISIFHKAETKNNPAEVFKGKVDKVVVGTKNQKKDNKQPDNIQAGMVYIKLENGQTQRVYNKKVSDLTPAERTTFLNKVIKFIALAKEVENNYQKGFLFSGTTEAIPLFGNGKKKGILDYFIAWNTKNPNFNIKLITDKKTKEKYISIHSGKDVNGRNIEDVIFIKDFYDSKGNIKNYQDPIFKPLLRFLENKYLNVISGETGNYKAKDGTVKKKFSKVPKGWKKVKDKNGKEVIEITYDYVESYDDFVLNNYLYTDVKEESANDVLPQRVNQYLTFESEVLPELPKPQRTADKKQTETETKEKSVKPTVKKKKLTDFLIAKTETTEGEITNESKLTDSKIQEVTLPNGNSYEVNIENGTIINKLTKNTISPTSSVGVQVLKQVNFETEEESTKPTPVKRKSRLTDFLIQENKTTELTETEAVALEELEKDPELDEGAELDLEKNLPSLKAEKTTLPKDIKSQKADIERRRQEELLIPQSLDKLPDYLTEGIKKSVEQLSINQRYEIVKQAILGKTAQQIVSELSLIDTDGRRNTEIVRQVRAYYGIPSQDTEGYQEWKNKVDKINAKYDAELAALPKEENKKTECKTGKSPKKRGGHGLVK